MANPNSTKRLKKLKELTPEELNKEKVTIKLNKEEKASISYDEQAANYVTEKLDKFRVELLLRLYCNICSFSIRTIRTIK